MRCAFLTTEFPTTLCGAGGLSTYTRRMARLLAGAGHEVEVFVLDAVRADVWQQEGYTVRHVPYVSSSWTKLRAKCLRNAGATFLAARLELQRAAQVMARALEVQHASEPFDVVQSSDYRGIGWAVPRSPGRVHVVRCSSAIDLYMEVDGRTDPDARAQIELEREVVAAADLVISPSALVAEHYRLAYELDVHVVRPPAYLEDEIAPRPLWLPPHYLVHFAGNLCRRKGTEFIIDALHYALAEEPSLTMLWAGRVADTSLESRILNAFPKNVLISERLAKPTLFAVVGDAAAAVLPSEVDNLPNTLIEALLLGTPVIATNGASLNEVVKNGVGARLVEFGDAKGLAHAMVSAWRGGIGKADKPWLQTELGHAFNPETALNAHIRVLQSHRAPN